MIHVNLTVASCQLIEALYKNYRFYFKFILGQFHLYIQYRPIYVFMYFFISLFEVLCEL